MVVYKPSKQYGLYYIIGNLLVYDVFFVFAIIFVKSYILSSLLKILLLILNIYHIRYILLHAYLKYGIDEEYIYITSLFKKHKIPYRDLKGYKILDEKINGIKLTGFATSYFALGKSVIKDIGTTNMFATTNKGIMYLKSKDGNFAISPRKLNEFQDVLEKNDIKQIEWKSMGDKDYNLHKNRSYIISFIAVSIIIIVLTLNPFVLYLSDKLPLKMPLNFDSEFLPVEYGTGKQFAFKQMIYGVLNMAILFCMYYASHFYAKYDKKSANRFIYASLVIAAAFLIIQIRILITFR